MFTKSKTVYCLEDKSYKTQADVSSYKITGQTQKLGTTRCAVLKVDGDKNTYLKPWEQLVNYHVQGEKNISAKLKTAQVRQIVKTAHTTSCDDVTFASLAKEYGVTPKTISDIAHGRSWTHVTRGLIYQLSHHNADVLDSCVKASNELRHKKVKLSPSMAKFIVRDHMLNNISVQHLADKFLMSKSAIRRVLSGTSWKETTVPAIQEYSNWK